MRASDPPVHDLVGTPKGRLTKLEKSFPTKPWAVVRDQVTVKLLDQDGELSVLARSAGRQDKERAMRRRRLKRLCKRLQELQRQTLSRDDLLLKLGAAKKDAGRAYGLMRIRVPAPDESVTAATFTFSLDRKKLRQVRRREGRYLLRSNLTGNDPVQLWTWYIQLTEVEQAFKELKGDLSVRPIYHQVDRRNCARQSLEEGEECHRELSKRKPLIATRRVRVPNRQGLAIHRNRVLRGAGVTPAAKRTQGACRPCD
jgi:hypothetical protein